MQHEADGHESKGFMDALRSYIAHCPSAAKSLAIHGHCSHLGKQYEVSRH